MGKRRDGRLKRTWGNAEIIIDREMETDRGAGHFVWTGGTPMNIYDLSALGNKVNERSGSNGGNSFLNLGKKGQIISGQICNVSDRITINFNGTEVSVAHNAVKNAKEGEIRKFQIQDISKDSLVLKEVGGTEEGGEIRTRMSTTVAANDYSFSEQLKNADNLAQSQAQAREDLAILGGDDCEKLEQEGNSLMENTKEFVAHAIEKNKAQKAWNEQKRTENLEQGAAMRENRRQMEALGFAQLKSEGELKSALENAGIPATPENLTQVKSALDMSEAALQMTDQTKYYIVSEKLAPTIENLYQGKYTVFADVPEQISDTEFEEYKGQIMEILQKSGLDTQEGQAYARWLFDHELPINAGTVGQMEELDRIAQDMTPSRILTQVIFAMSEGLEAKEAILDDQAFVVAKEAIKDLRSITDREIIRMSDFLIKNPSERQIFGEVLTETGADGGNSGEEPEEAREISVTLALYKQMRGYVAEEEEEEPEKEIPLVIAPDMSEEERMQVTLKRQLEEVRQKMTMQAAVRMEQKGIHVETEPLEHVIRELRQMENDYTVKQLSEKEDIEVADLKETVTDAQMDLFQEALEKTNDISESFAGILGTDIRHHRLLTVNELHAAVTSRSLGRQEWQNSYEKVKTTVRADLGDSIQQAFETVPKILSEIGMEDTEANERAARILGYNSMEITKDNITEVKVFDAKVNRVIDNMKPTTVLELIRQGENPLNTPLDELNEKLQLINERNGVSNEERYARFLWQLDRSGQISNEERMGYIGIYRLLHQIERSDGAAIGAVMELGQEMTLGNLLTQTRIKKSPGVDITVDNTEGVKGKVSQRLVISDQIEAGFSGDFLEDHTEGQMGDRAQDQPARYEVQQGFSGQEERDPLEKDTETYYQNLVKESIDEMTPGEIHHMTDGDLQRLLGVSIERFAEQMRQADGTAKLKKEYYEQMAKEIREGLRDGSTAEEVLQKLAVPTTIGNILAANELLSEEGNVYRELYNRRKVLNRNREKELDKTIDNFQDAVGDEESLERNCEQAEKIMQEVLTKTYESSDIHFEDLQHLKKIDRGLKLQVAFRKSQSYDIPIRTGDTITSLNLTIVRGADETGKVQISMEDGNFGNISLDFKVTSDAVKGLVLCSERQGFETLRERQELWEQGIEHAGFSVKNISYGMDFKSRNDLLDESERVAHTDTSRLYQLSKVLVRQLTDAIRMAS